MVSRGHFPREQDLLELLGTIAKRHEAQDPEQNTNSFGTDIFDGTNIYSLTVVTKPVAKVDLDRQHENI